MLKVLRNVARNASKRGNARVILQKVVRRFTEQPTGTDVRAWCEERVEEVDAFGRAVDEALWEESTEYALRLDAHARETLASLPVKLGGSGHYALLYFLVRKQRPRVALETGVAAGFSSHAVLSAMEANGEGQLFSSDFPYFRLENPERYVGVLVPEALRHRWTLHIEGDARNLDAILPALPGPIDFAHYDSDKSYAARERTLARLAPKLAPDAVLIVDDIQDNAHYRDYAERQGVPFRVFTWKKKFLAVSGGRGALS